MIENPVDLKTIARRIQEGAYASLLEMERDLMLMCRNACQFNEPGSQIYKDAKILKKIIVSAAKKQESSGVSMMPKITSAATSTRSKRGRSAGQSLIATTAALADEDEDESDDEEEDVNDGEESDNPQWQLFQTIKTAPNSQGILASESPNHSSFRSKHISSFSGVRMSEYYWKLPSKRLYPDYYKSIKNPISLYQIRTKIKVGLEFLSHSLQF